MIAIQTSERNGKLVGATLVDDKDEIMLISTAGVLIRTDYRALGASELLQALRQDRLHSPRGDDLLEVLIRRLQAS